MSRFLGRFALPVAVIAVASAIALPATADPRTITVLMPDGSMVTVQVDVPRGTPLTSITLPAGGVPVEDSWGELQAPAPVPAPEAPPGTPAPDPLRQQQEDQQQQEAQQQESAEKAEEQAKEEEEAEERERKRKRKRGSREKDEVDEEEAAEEDERTKRRRRRDVDNRNSDGSPTRTNPSFIEALPGPARVTGVPNFVIRKFRVPIFLMPIYQAAGIQYGVRWEILAAINEIETDYGRNLNVSSAGALGWMQFMPATWRSYGVDANKDGEKDPYNPVDAIFAAARYLRAAGYAKDVRRAIFAYNHADWYVDSVLLRARLIAGVPGDLVGSLTGLTEGRFPVYAKARYADDLSEKEVEKRFHRGQNAANLVEGDDERRSIEIYARKGAPVVAVNDGVVKKVGYDEQRGNFVTLQDVYGNRYTYSGLGRVSRFYPVPRTDLDDSDRTRTRALKARRDKAPTEPASAGRSDDPDELVPIDEVRPKVAVKERLFAHPERRAARGQGGLEQLLNARAKRGGYETFRNYFSRPLGLKGKDMRIRRLKKGSRVIGGTILGRVGRPAATKAAHLVFEIRPAGRGAPLIDPKPILDGWKLLEATAIYRSSGRNILYDQEGKDTVSIGQILLLPKHLLERRVLSDDRIEIYPCGRRDIRSGQVDRRVLASLAYLSESGLRPTVTSLKCGHSVYTSSGNVSHHSSGNAVDIAKINGVPILGHQEDGSVTEQTVRRLLRLQGTLQPDQIISLREMGGPTVAMADHDDHIHLGFRPLFGSNSKLGKQASAILKPGQWDDLLERLRSIDNPVVRTKPSEYSLPVRKKRASEAHRGE